MKATYLSNRPKRFLLMLVCFVLLFGYSVGAQQSVGQPQQSDSPPPAAAVRLSVIVTDRQNRTVSGLRQEDFRVLEEGIPQAISFFSREDLPVSYGFVMDNSDSLRRHIGYISGIGKTLLRNKRPDDEAFIVRFTSSDAIEVVREFTTDVTSLLSGMEDLYTEGGQTALIDALYLSVEKFSEQRSDERNTRRRVLVLITDGENRDSYYSQRALTELLRAEDVQIFTVGFIGHLNRRTRQRAENFLNLLASETGGRTFFPTSSPISIDELLDIAEQIHRSIRTQYVIGYNPANQSRLGEYRRVQVTITGGPENGYVALTRAGYITRSRR